MKITKIRILFLHKPYSTLPYETQTKMITQHNFQNCSKNESLPNLLTTKFKLLSNKKLKEKFTTCTTTTTVPSQQRYSIH